MRAGLVGHGLRDLLPVEPAGLELAGALPLDVAADPLEVGPQAAHLDGPTTAILRLLLANKTASMTTKTEQGTCTIQAEYSDDTTTIAVPNENKMIAEPVVNGLFAMDRKPKLAIFSGENFTRSGEEMTASQSLLSPSSYPYQPRSTSSPPPYPVIEQCIVSVDPANNSMEVLSPPPQEDDDVRQSVGANFSTLLIDSSPQTRRDDDDPIRQDSPGTSSTTQRRDRRTNRRPLKSGKWFEKYQELIQYKAKYGHCQVPHNWPGNVTLAQW